MAKKEKEQPKKINIVEEFCNQYKNITLDEAKEKFFTKLSGKVFSMEFINKFRKLQRCKLVFVEENKITINGVPKTLNIVRNKIDYKFIMQL